MHRTFYLIGGLVLLISIGWFYNAPDWEPAITILVAIGELVGVYLHNKSHKGKLGEKFDMSSPQPSLGANHRNEEVKLTIKGISIDPNTISDYGNSPYYMRVLFDVIKCPKDGFILRLDQIDVEIEFYQGSKIISKSFVESKFLLPDNSPFFEKDNLQIKVKTPSPFYYFAHFSHDITSAIRSNPITVRLKILWSREDWKVLEFIETVPVSLSNKWSLWQSDGYIDKRTLFRQ